MCVCLFECVCVCESLAFRAGSRIFKSLEFGPALHSGLSLFFTSSFRYPSQLFFKIRFLHLKYLSQTSWSCLKAIWRYHVSRRFCLDVQINQLVKKGRGKS